MTGKATEIRTILAGVAAPLVHGGQSSAIAKRPLAGPVRIGALGLEGDEQADRRHHGGPEKAVHHYALDHYAAWRDELSGEAAAAALAAPGAFGENLSTLGLTEAEVCVGDVWRAGFALLQVSQARQPCWKLDYRFGVDGMARRVQDSGLTGWYYRVVEPGMAVAGQALELVDRPCPEWTLARLLRMVYVDRMNREALQEIAALGTLSASWRDLAARRLERGVVEDWSPRLAGHRVP